MRNHLPWVALLTLFAAACTATPPPKAPQPAGPTSTSSVSAPATPVKPSGPVKAGLLVPLSGQYAGLGALLRNSAEMALFERAGDDFELVIEDTQGTPEGARVAAQRLLGQQVDIILGPLFSTSAQTVGQIAGATPVVAFSNNQNIAQPGLYVIGFTPVSQVKTVVGHAASQGLTRFAALLPNNAAQGQAVAQALQARAAEIGGQVVAVEYYDPTTADITAQVGRLVETPGYDALLLPVAGPQLVNLVSQLQAGGVGMPQVRYLGSIDWDHPAATREPALVGSWFPAVRGAEYDKFRQTFAQTFGVQPDKIAVLAYDAVALAVTLARTGGDAAFSAQNLTNPNGFAGASGIFRFNADGTVDHGYAVMEVAPGNFQMVTPPRTTFDTQPGV